MKYDYDEISPITNNKCVLIEHSTNGDISKICMESGYTTSTLHKYNGDVDMEQVAEMKMPDILISTKYVDEYGFTWYLSVIPTPVGTITPIPSDKEYTWGLIPAKGMHGYDTTMYFSKDEFPNAMDEMQRRINQIRIKDEEE